LAEQPDILQCPEDISLTEPFYIHDNRLILSPSDGMSAKMATNPRPTVKLLRQLSSVARVVIS
jgi:hypothetical protein